MDPYKVCNIFQNGVLLRTVLDSVTGDLSDTRTRYLGVRPVKLFRITMQGSEAVSVLFYKYVSFRNGFTYFYFYNILIKDFE